MKSGTGDDPYADSGGATDAEAAAHARGLQDAVVDALQAIQAGDRADQMSARHEGYTALLEALEGNGELERVAEALADDLGVDVGKVNRSRVVTLAIGLGLQTGAPEAMEALQEAQAEIARRDL